MTTKQQNNWKFSTHLVITFITSAAIGIFAFSFIIAAISSFRTKEHLILEMEHVIGSLSDDSILPLLTESPVDGKEILKKAYNLPNIAWSGLINRDKTLFVSKSVNLNNQHYLTISKHLADKTGYFETTDYIYFYSPVINKEIGNNNTFIDEFGNTPIYSQIIGYIAVAYDKKDLKVMQNQSIIDSILVACIGMFIVLFFLLFVSRKITRPLHILSSLIKNAGERNVFIHAPVKGPQEIISLSKQYNTLIKKIKERDKRLVNQNEELEKLVEDRTVELKYAIDNAVQANKDKSTFLANVSHDLRTPLQAILGYANDLRNENNTELLHLGLKQIQESSEFLSILIDQLLESAKIESGIISVNKSVFNLYEIADEVIQLLQPLTRPGVTLKLVCNNKKMLVNSDRLKLKQILINICSNSVKYTHTGNISLQITHSGLENKTVNIEIVDTGIGIPKADLAHIFDAFYQLDNHKNAFSYTAGTGLGLSIVKSHVKTLGGSLSVDSEVGTGTSFHIMLPVGDIDTVAKPSLTTAGKSILLAEDDSVLRDLFTRILERSNHVVIPAFDGQHAIAELTSGNHDINLAIVDLHMPFMSGLDVIRTAQEKGISIPFFLMSADTTTATVNSAKALGVSIIEKPIDIDTFSHIVNTSRNDHITTNTISHERQAPIEHYEEKPIIDNDVVNKLVILYGMDDFKKTLVNAYIKQTVSIKEELASAISDNDMARAKKLIHKLTGSSKSIGAMNVGHICEKLRRHIENDTLNNPNTLKFLIEELSDNILAFKEYIGTFELGGISTT